MRRAYVAGSIQGRSSLLKFLSLRGFQRVVHRTRLKLNSQSGCRAGTGHRDAEHSMSRCYSTLIISILDMSDSN
jgi:hypothetical protein